MLRHWTPPRWERRHDDDADADAALRVAARHSDDDELIVCLSVKGKASDRSAEVKKRADIKRVMESAK